MVIPRETKALLKVLIAFGSKEALRYMRLHSILRTAFINTNKPGVY